MFTYNHCSIALAVWSTLCVQTVLANEPVSSAIKEELARQQAIYNSGAARPEGYVIGRTFAAYAHALSGGFVRSLSELGPADRWLDIGAGEGQAILDYSTARFDDMEANVVAKLHNGVKAVAMSIEDRRTQRWHDTAATLGTTQIQYLFGKPLSDYSNEELGQFQVITDVMGGFSYSPRLSQFMEKTLSLLTVGGSYHTVLADVHSESGQNRPHYANSPYLTEISSASGAEVKMCSWLKRITCVQVSCEFRSDWRPPIEVYRISKTCNDVKVPGLVQTHFQAGTPPERRFMLVDTAPAAPMDDVAASPQKTNAVAPASK